METVTTARDLAQRLTETAEKYHRGEVTHEAFRAAQRATWDEANALGFSDEVLGILRARYSISEVRA